MNKSRVESYLFWSTSSTLVIEHHPGAWQSVGETDKLPR